MKKVILTTALLTAFMTLAKSEVSFAGCADTDYVEIQQDPVNILTKGLSYTPKCLKVKIGKTVIIQGSTFHPIQGVNSLDNPFFNPAGSSTTDLTKVMTKAGTFSYYCTRHGDANGAGMAGSILVVE